VIAGDRSTPRDYWSQRLLSDYSLRGTGHLSYSESYNAWLYRAKRRALRPLLARLVPGEPALDLGSGTGWVISELQRRGVAVEGCDIAPVAVERLRQAVPGVAFFELELGSEPIPRADGAFAAITALDVLYHVTEDAAWLRALAEIARVIRPGGVLIVSDGFGDEDLVPAAHVRFRSLRRWRAAATDVGLELASLHPLYRWLSRDPELGAMARLPGAVRGPLEYGLDLLWRRPPHMRIAVLERPRP
jgi:SAM-dependent methyltransferase